MTISQLNMLKLFMQRNFTSQEALTLDQRIFGGLCAHRWVDYQIAPHRNELAGVFAITSTGHDTYELARIVHNFRKNNNGRFSIRVPRVRRSNMIAFSKHNRSAA